jgi:hypothetical protein
MIGSRMCLSMLAAAVALGGGGCAARQAVWPGTAFSPDYGTSIGSPPIRPGMEFGWLYLYLDDTSKSALVLNLLRISGAGIGTVARVVEVKVAPLRSGYHRVHDLTGTPGGTYKTDPPVVLDGGQCHKQALFPVPGHRLTPGSEVRIYIVLRAARPGNYAVQHQVVYYTQNGVRYRQAFPIRFWGSVAKHAPVAPVDILQAVCVKQARARVLPSWPLPRNLKQSRRRLLKLIR